MLFFASCITDKLATDTIVSREVVAVPTDPLSVPLDKALAEMYSTMDILYGPATRSSRPAIASIETLKGEHLGNKTRSGDPLPENMYYIISFENNKGFAILGADLRTESLLCITESGSMLIEDLVGTRQVDTRGYSEELTLADLWVEEDQEYLIGSNMNRNGGPNQDLLKKAITRLVETPTEVPVEYEYGEWERGEMKGPFISTRWHQDRPFNENCPHDRRDNNNLCSAGCVAIALAQIIAYNEKPTPSHFGATSTWEQIRNYDYRIGAGSTGYNDTIVRDIAKIVRHIGDGVNMKYGISKGSSFATPVAAKRYLKNDLDYANVKKFESYKESEIYSMLDNDYPVFIAGLGKPSDGHAWIIDGYLKQSRVKTTIYVGDNRRSRETETRTLVHCNYGWQGVANGYYLSKVFNTKQGPLLTEPGIDNSSPDNKDWMADWWFRVVKYSK